MPNNSKYSTLFKSIVDGGQRGVDPLCACDFSAIERDIKVHPTIVLCISKILTKSIVILLIPDKNSLASEIQLINAQLACHGSIFLQLQQQKRTRRNPPSRSRFEQIASILIGGKADFDRL